MVVVKHKQINEATHIRNSLRVVELGNQSISMMMMMMMMMTMMMMTMMMMMMIETSVSQRTKKFAAV